MVEVGIIPERRTETLTQSEKGCEAKGKGFLKGTTLFSISRERGLQQMGSICYVNSPEGEKQLKCAVKNVTQLGRFLHEVFHTAFQSPNGF